MEEDLEVEQEIVVEDDFKNDPIGLLVFLITKAKEDITIVKLSQFTEQFVDYIKNTKDIDLEKASQFIEIATTLLEIKAKRMLPKEEEDVVTDELDPEEALRRRLILYTMFKDASAELSSLENINHFYKEPDKSANDFRIVLTNFNLDAMLDSFAKILVKVEKNEKLEEPKKIIRDRFTVADKMNVIKTAIKDKKHMTFTSLFEDSYTKSEIITVFLALLELLKRQVVMVEQEKLFEEIVINQNEDYKENEEDIVTEFDDNTDSQNEEKL